MISTLSLFIHAYVHMLMRLCVVESRLINLIRIDRTVHYNV